MHWILLLNIFCNGDLTTNSIVYDSPVTCNEAKAFFEQNKQCRVESQCIIDADIND